MKRLLIAPLLIAGFFSPIAAKAEVLNLKCDLNFKTGKQTVIFNIDLEEKSARIEAKRGKFYADEVIVRSADIGVMYWDKKPKGIESIYVIDRLSGEITLKNTLNKVAKNNPYFDETYYENMKKLIAKDEKVANMMAGALFGSETKGSCKKTKKLKTKF